MIRRSLASSVGAARIKRCFFIETDVCRRASVHFVRAYVYKSRKMEFPGSLKQAMSPQDVGSQKGRGVFYAAIHVCLRREIH